MYNKQVDNLRTNHRGIYVIQDLSYRAFLRVSVPKGYESEMDEICKKVNQYKCTSFSLTYHRLIPFFFRRCYRWLSFHPLSSGVL